MQPLSHSYKN